ncbi:MAG: acyl-CoA dehydrogenase family protein [Pseudomonadota bacterium]
MQVRPTMIPRNLFEPEHEQFRASVARFMDEEVMPHHEAWEAQQYCDRSVWLKAGELGMLCMTMPEAYGGLGADRRYSMIMLEEIGRVGATGLGFNLHSDIVANYINGYGTEAQKTRWLPPMARGEVISAIAMTEPGTGSDLQAIKTRAVEDGDDFIVNGSKIFITNGYLCDLAVVAVKTGDEDEGASSVSLLIVEADREGFTKGEPLKKMGMHAQDTCELFFQDVRVPKSNLVGELGGGFIVLMQELAWERLMIGIGAQAAAAGVLNYTIDYVKERTAFNKPVFAFQNTRFKLAELKTDIAIGQTYIDRCMEQQLDEALGIDAAAAAKFWCSDMLSRVVDECVQLHGGYGYMMEYPIARAYIDQRALRIYGGSNEIMKDLIARGI